MGRDTGGADGAAQRVALFERDRAGQAAVGVRHIAFWVDRENFEAAQDDRRRRRIAFEFQDHNVAHSIYFEDPDGPELELTTYDVGQGRVGP